MKIRLTVIILFLLSRVFGQVSIEYVKKTRTYGIKNEKTKQWLTQPVYKDIRKGSYYTNKKAGNDYFIADNGKKKLLISPAGTKSVSPLFDEINTLNTNPELFIVKIKNEYAFFLAGNGILKEPGYFSNHEAPWFDERFIKIKKGGKFLLVNTAKNGIFSPEFDDIADRIPDTIGIFVAKKNNKWGVVDFAGSVKINFEFDTIRMARLPEQYPAVFELKMGNKWGLKDLLFKDIFPCKYDAFDFKTLNQFADSIPEKYFGARLNSKWGMVTLKGKQVIPNEYDTIPVLKRNKYLYVVKNKKMGVVNAKNKEIFPFIYEKIVREDEGCFVESREKLYLVSKEITKGTTKTPLWGMCDSTGKVLQEVNANKIPLMRNYTYVNQDNYKYDGYDDSTLIGYLWNIGGELKDEVKSADTVEMAQIDQDGNEYIAKVYSERYITTVKGGKTGIIARNGKAMVPVIFDDIILCMNQADNGDLGCRASTISNGKTIPYGNSADYYSTNITNPPIVKKDGKWGVMQFNGKEIIPCVYDSIFSDYTSCQLDANDSVYRSLQFPRTFFRVYKSGYFGYISPTGNELISPGILADLNDFLVVKYDSALRDGYYPEVKYDSIRGNRYNDYMKSVVYSKVLVNKGKPKGYSLYRPIESFDGYNESYVVTTLADNFTYIENAKFGFQNSSTVKMIGDKWTDDVILIDRNFRTYRLSTFKGQYMLSLPGTYDSIVDFTTKKRVFKDAVFPRPEGELFILDYMFSKYEGKWYLQNFFKPGFINDLQGFDSVEVNSSRDYKAWRGGKFAYYNFKYTGPYNLERSLEYPADPKAERIACRNCDYRIKKYPRQSASTIYNEIGDAVRDTLIHYNIEVPLLTKGTYNFIDTANYPVFKTWADEIIVPPLNGYTFNMSDSTSGVFEDTNLEKNAYPFFGTNKRTVALKYGAKWRLSSAKDPNVFVEGFKEVKIEGDNWVVKKKKKPLYYSIDGLKLIKKK